MYHFPEEPSKELEPGSLVKPVINIKQEHPQMEEVPWYTPPANATQENSWINAPQLLQSNNTTPTQSTPQMELQAPPTSQMTQPVTIIQNVTPSNTQMPISNVRSLPTV